MSQWHFGNSTLKAGVRYDRISYSYDSSAKSLEQSDDLWGAELGYNYVFTKAISAFIDFSHSYQAPDVDRFFTPDYSTTPPGIKFNGFIDPMKADTCTVGFNHLLKLNKFKLTVYYADIKDEIYYYSDPGFIHSANTNIDRSYKYGIDLYDKWLIGKQWNLTLNYNYVKAVIDEEKQNGENYSGNELPGVPNHNVKIALSFLPDSYSNITISQIYRSEAYAANDFNNNFAQKQDAFYSTNLSGAYTKDNYEVFAKINNLFNQSNGLWIQDNTIYPVSFATSFIAGFKLKY
jgi:iron complex outermembrane receptor protein